MVQRYAAKKDTSHNEIAQAAKSLGCKVKDTSKFGDGFPDMVIILPNGKVMLVEAKTEGKIDFSQDELRFVIDLVQPCYRVLTNAEGVVKMVQEENQ